MSYFAYILYCKGIDVCIYARFSWLEVMPPSERAYAAALLACQEAEQWDWVEHFSKMGPPAAKEAADVGPGTRGAGLGLISSTLKDLISDIN